MKNFVQGLDDLEWVLLEVTSSGFLDFVGLQI